MNDKIINNLYELWEHIGTVTNTLFTTENFSSVAIDGSDWPKRIFNLQNDKKSIAQILQLHKAGTLPGIVPVPKPNSLSTNTHFEFVMQQTNMALDLSSVSKVSVNNPHIKRVTTEKEAIQFAETASNAFGYNVDPTVISRIITDSENPRLCIYEENGMSLGCGLVYFDSLNIAGLHMIGTVPEGRGKGVGKCITEKLLQEAKVMGGKQCVLHASVMGETIYKKLGFEAFGILETYRIVNKT